MFVLSVQALTPSAGRKRKVIESCFTNGSPLFILHISGLDFGSLEN